MTEWVIKQSKIAQTLVLISLIFGSPMANNLGTLHQPLFISDNPADWEAHINATASGLSVSTAPVQYATDWHPNTNAVEVTVADMPSNGQLWVSVNGENLNLPQDTLVSFIVEIDGDADDVEVSGFSRISGSNGIETNLSGPPFDINRVDTLPIAPGRNKRNIFVTTMRWGNAFSMTESGTVDYGQPFNHLHWFFQRQSATAGGEFKVRILGWYTGWQTNKAVVRLSMDDNRKDQATYLLPATTARNIPWTAFFLRDRTAPDGASVAIEGALNMDEAELQLLVDSPLVYIGSHGMSHVNMSGLSGAALTAQIADAETVFVTRGYMKSTNKVFSTPFGDYNQAVIDELQAQGYVLHRTTEGLPQVNNDLDYLGATGSNLHPMENKCSVDLGNGHLTAAEVILDIERAKALGGELNIYGHSFPDVPVGDPSLDTTMFPRSEMNILLDYVQAEVAAGRLFVATYEELASEAPGGVPVVPDGLPDPQGISSMFIETYGSRN